METPADTASTIRAALARKNSDELLRIWIEHDERTWTDAAFVAISSILTERGIEIPPYGGDAAKRIAEERHTAPKKDRSRAACYVIGFLCGIPLAMASAVVFALVGTILHLPERWASQLASIGCLNGLICGSAWVSNLLIKRRENASPPDAASST